VAAIQRQCGKPVEFGKRTHVLCRNVQYDADASFAVFLNPPIVLEAGDLAGLTTDKLDSTATFDAPELVPRAWWKSNEDRTVYYGHHESVLYIRDFLHKSEVPFDVGNIGGALLLNLRRN
jgi:hypothetical protein